MNWERIIRLPFLPGIAVLILLIRMMLNGLSWGGVALLLFSLLWFSLALIDSLVQWRLRQMARISAFKNTVAETQTQLSLVILLEEPREVEADSIIRCIEDALSLDERGREDLVVETVSEEGKGAFGGAEGDPERSPPILNFLVTLRSGVFGITVSARPYLEEATSFARSAIPDKRLRTAIEHHQGWLSVDLVSATPEEPEGRYRAYRVIGKILAAMAGPDCLAVYAPELKKCNEFDPSLIEKLRSDSPLSIFNEPTFDPVIEIDEDNPRMVAAVEEARSRWGEFELAFSQRGFGREDRFIVKAEFVEDGRSEFMWMSVTALENGQITGVLMNDPHQLIGVHRGGEVSVSTGQLNDWLYPNENGDVVGGFTLKVLADESEERRRRGGEGN